MSPPIAGGAAPPRPPWWMLVLAALFAGYYILLLSSDLARPEPMGFVLGVHASETTVRAVAPASPAARAGLEVGDRVLTANLHPTRSRLDWLSVEMNLQTDRPLRLELDRGADAPPAPPTPSLAGTPTPRSDPAARAARGLEGTGGSRTVTIVPGRAPWSYWLTTAGMTLLGARGVQLIALALALVVAWRRPFDPAARAGAWLLASIAVYSIVWPYQIAATWRALPAVVGLALWIPFASSLAVAAVVFTFFATFPRPLIGARRTWLLVWAPMAVVLALQLQFTWRVVYRPDDTGDFIDWTPLSAVTMTAYATAAVAILVVGYRRLTDLTERRRVRVLVVGSSVGLLSALPVAAGYWWRSQASIGDSIFVSPAAALGSIASLALPVSLGYAILRHRLFDIRLMLRLGLQYALARRVLVSIVPAAGAILLADLWVNRATPFADVVRVRGWGYAALAGLAVLARLRRDDWLDALDRRFFRERLSAQRLLRGIGDEVRSAASLDAVAPRGVGQIEAALHPEFVALLRRCSHESVYHTVAMAPASARQGAPALSADTKVVDLLRWGRRPLQVAAGGSASILRHLPREDVEWLSRTNAELLVPVQLGEGKTEALFALGPKRSEEPYSAEDEDLLMAIADSFAWLLAQPATVPPERAAFEECPTCGACYDFGAGRCPRDAALLGVTSLPRLLGGRYRLDRRVGRGGMGTVYAALDSALGRPVAAKVLREDLVAPDAADRFQSEARLAAALAHPNVVTVHDIGVTASGRAFFIMELLDGVTLRDELRRTGPLAPGRVVHIVRAIGSAVEAAHRQKLVHRDLKPENVFLCRSDTVEIPKVLDFGLAKALEAGGGGVLTMPGLVAGTPQYMAPEHLAGDSPSPDWDLWALAVMAYEMITGALPSPGAPGAAGRLDHLPAGLRALFSRALSVNPIDRPTSAREFADELACELNEAAEHGRA